MVCGAALWIFPLCVLSVRKILSTAISGILRAPCVTVCSKRSLKRQMGKASHILQSWCSCGGDTPGLWVGSVWFPLHSYMLPTFTCKDGRDTEQRKGKQTKGNRDPSGTGYLQLSLSCASYSPNIVYSTHLCLSVIPFILLQARTVRQEVLGLRKAIFGMK